MGSLMRNLTLRGRTVYGAADSADFWIRRCSVATFAVSLLALLALVPTTSVIATERRDQPRWVGTWTASPRAVAAPIWINGQTVRQFVHTSLGGERVRVRFSNAYGTSGLVIGSAHLAISSGGASISSGTDRVLKFNGSPTITIPAGALAVSDPVTLDVPALGDLAVSLYLPENVTATTQHVAGQQTTYISSPGDFTAASTLAATTTTSFYFLSGVEVRAPERARAIIALGDW